MPKEKSNSLVSSTKKLKKKQQKNDGLATLNIETLDDNKNEKNTKKKTTLKKSHNKSLSAPNFTKLEQLNKLQTNLNETFATTDLQNTDSSASLVNQDFSSFILNNNNNNKQFPPISELTSPSLRSTSRSNDRFRQLFPSVPLSETVIDSKLHTKIITFLNFNYIYIYIKAYSCAYVKSFNLLHGVMFLSKSYICFYSKILTSETILILKLKHINSITKTMHALIFPTAIRIETKNSTYSFTSFRSRSHTLDHLTSLLNQSRQVCSFLK